GVQWDNVNLEIVAGMHKPAAATVAGIMSPRFSNIAVLGPAADVELWSSGGLVTAHNVDARVAQLTAKRLGDVVSVRQTAGSEFVDVLSEDNHHAIDHAVWSYNGHIRNMFSTIGDGSVETHPAFDIHFSNVVEVDNSCVGVRAFGTSLRNVEKVNS